MSTAEDIPLVFFDSKVYRAQYVYIRVTTFMSPNMNIDRGRVEHIVEIGESAAGPWTELTSHL